MKVMPLKIDGALIIKLKKFEDCHGFFYKSSRNEIIKKYYGCEYKIYESNTTLSNKNSFIDYLLCTNSPMPRFTNQLFPKKRHRR